MTPEALATVRAVFPGAKATTDGVTLPVRSPRTFVERQNPFSLMAFMFPWYGAVALGGGPILSHSWLALSPETLIAVAGAVLAVIAHRRYALRVYYSAEATFLAGAGCVRLTRGPLAQTVPLAFERRGR